MSPPLLRPTRPPTVHETIQGPLCVRADCRRWGGVRVGAVAGQREQGWPPARARLGAGWAHTGGHLRLHCRLGRTVPRLQLRVRGRRGPTAPPSRSAPPAPCAAPGNGCATLCGVKRLELRPHARRLRLRVHINLELAFCGRDLSRHASGVRLALPVPRKQVRSGRLQRKRQPGWWTRSPSPWLRRHHAATSRRRCRAAAPPPLA